MSDHETDPTPALDWTAGVRSRFDLYREHVRETLVTGRACQCGRSAHPVAEDVPALLAEVERLTEENGRLRAQREQAARLVGDLVRADNNRCGSGPDGRITGADTLPLQTAFGLSLTLRDVGEGYRRGAERDAERDVIEKAKTWRAEHGYFDESLDSARALAAAVDALAQPAGADLHQTVRRGEETGDE